MPYQSNVNIKEETLSPAGSCYSNPGIDAWQVRTSTNDRPMDQQNRPLAKRFKSESEELPELNSETKSRLKSTVLGRRRARGEDTEIPSNLFEEPKPCKLTSVDLEKRAKRKKQNREAAKRCRAKKKQDQDMTAQERSKCVEENVKLQQLILLYLGIIVNLKRRMTEHLGCGDCKLSSAVQAEHRQQFCQPLDQLMSPLRQDLLPHFLSTTPRIDWSDLEQCGQNYQPSNNDTSCEMPYSVSSNDTADYSRYEKSDCQIDDSLPSWDLMNIQPDLFNSDVTDGILIDTKPSDLASNPDHWQQVNQLPDNHDLFNTPSVLESGSAICTTQINARDPGNIDISFSKLAYRVDDIVTAHTCTNTERSVQLPGRNPHNLVQPNIATLNTVPSLLHPLGLEFRVNSCNGSISSGTIRHSQTSNVNHDLNNNIPTGRQTTKTLGDRGLSIYQGGLPMLNNFITNRLCAAPTVDLPENSTLTCLSLNPISPDSYRQ